MIHLVKEGDFSKDERKESVLDHTIKVHRDFCGVKLSPEDFQEFQKIVNERRPYCREDFIPQTFIPDLSNIRY